MIETVKIAAKVTRSFPNNGREGLVLRFGNSGATPAWSRLRQCGIRAFSLVEVLAAAFVVAIIFAVLFAGIAGTFKMLDTAREGLRGTQVAMSRIEELRLCAWSSDQLFNTNVVPPTFTDSFYPLGLKDTTNTGTKYYGTINVTTNFALSPSATYSNDLALVTVSVNWTNHNGRAVLSHHCTMNTFIAKYGMQNYVFSH